MGLVWETTGYLGLTSFLGDIFRCHMKHILTVCGKYDNSCSPQKVSLTVSCKSSSNLWIKQNLGYLQGITGTIDPVQQGAGSVLRAPEAVVPFLLERTAPAIITAACKVYFLKKNMTECHAFKF